MAIKKDPRWAFVVTVTSDNSDCYFTLIRDHYEITKLSFENESESEVLAYDKFGERGFLETDYFLSMLDKHFDEFVLLKDDIRKMRIGIDKYDRISKDPEPALRELITLFEA